MVVKLQLIERLRLWILWVTVLTKGNSQAGNTIAATHFRIRLLPYGCPHRQRKT